MLMNDNIIWRIGRMGIFASEGKAGIFDYQAGIFDYQAGMSVRSIICHGALHRKYCDKLLRSLMFKSSRFQGTSLNSGWL
jgi:hypothetical protein